VGLLSKVGHAVWNTMGSNLEVIAHASGISILPDEKLVDITVTPEARATVEERIAEVKRKNEQRRRE